MRYDALLTRQLAAELNRMFAQQPVHGIELQPETQQLLIDVGENRLLWNLHPTRGYLVRTAAVLPLEKPIQLPRQAKWRKSHALFDDRIMFIEVGGGTRPHAAAQLVIELLTNQWNAITLDADGKVLRRLVTRVSAGRDLRRGQVYDPPPANDARSTASLTEWKDYFQGRDRLERKQIFLQRFAYASPLNAEAVVAPEDAQESFQRYQDLLKTFEPHVIATGDGGFVYSHRLWATSAFPHETLLAAMEAVAGVDVYEDVAEELARRINSADKKIERLNQELAAIGTRAGATRLQADLLMAYASTITRGVKRVTLPDFEGNDRQIDLDPALSAMENAQEMYADAKKQARASERIPRLIEQAERQRRHWLDLHERAVRNELKPDDIRALIRKAPKQKQRAAAVEKLPYRRYKTSGGLEVRVGRSSRANDELTLNHASPRDVWLHARHVGGAHVVLRWNVIEANPPLRDLMEAAVLAAIHSKARTSRTVPVDYTRRKYVRKRRKSPPGQVMIERAKTLFVEPSEDLEEQLRWVEE